MFSQSNGLRIRSDSSLNCLDRIFSYPRGCGSCRVGSGRLNSILFGGL